MKSVWKFELPKMTLSTVIEMPEGAEIVHVDLQDGVPCLWAVVSTDRYTRVESRAFKVVGTGWEFEEQQRHVGTILDGTYVWHVFELDVPRAEIHG